MLHAVILIGEAAGLFWMSAMLHSFFAHALHARSVAEQAQAKSECATQDLQASQIAERGASVVQDEFRERVAKKQLDVVSCFAANLTKIANGDLTVRIDTNFDDEYEQIKRNFNNAIGRLEEAVRGVAQGTERVRSGTDEISLASDDLSRRTEHQAASLEESAAR